MTHTMSRDWYSSDTTMLDGSGATTVGVARTPYLAPYGFSLNAQAWCLPAQHGQAKPSWRLLRRTAVQRHRLQYSCNIQLESLLFRRHVALDTRQNGNSESGRLFVYVTR